MRKLWKRAKQALLWVAVKLCEIIVFVVDTVVAVVEVVKETAKAAAEVTVEVVQRVRANKVVQTIGEGVDTLKKIVGTLKKIKDIKEFPNTIRRIGKSVWAFATGKACFSWAASSGWCTLCSLGYTAFLLAGFTFSLYLLGLLNTVFRS